MTESVKLTGASSALGTRWKSINWSKVNAHVQRLQMRIAKAVEEKRWNKVKSLQWLLSHLIEAKLLAVKRVSSRKRLTLSEKKTKILELIKISDIKLHKVYQGKRQKSTF